MTEDRLEGLLADTAAAVAYPATPDLRERVVGRLLTGQPRSRAIAHTALRPMLVMLALIVVVAALAITPSREAIGRFFGVEGSKIEVLPTASPGTPAPLPSVPSGRYQGLRPITLEEARGLSAIRVAEPRTSARFRQAFIVAYAAQPVVVLAYESFDLWQTRLSQDAFFGKEVPGDALILETSVNGETATWLSGRPHTVAYYAAPNRPIPESFRLVERNTLIWRTDAAFYRIETDLPMEEAIRIAETLP